MTKEIIVKHPIARISLAAATCALAMASVAPAHAAKVLVLSNQGADEVVADFTAKTVGHTYTGMAVDNSTPSLAELNQHDVVLLFENGLFDNAKAVGDAVAQYYNQGGKCVVIGTFYWQDRSDNPNFMTPGWGALEDVDVFNGLAGGSEYAPDSLDPNSIVPHPITQGVTSLSADSYRGGVDAKPGTTVLGKWLGPNNLGNADPVVGFREDDNGGRFVGISIFPDYESYGDYGANFNGDFHKLFGNTFAWCASPCGNGMVDNGEECDDGNNMSGDGCTGLCKLEKCGDGVDNNADAEECDDGNVVDTDLCTSLCQIAACGDGFVQDGVEACDDGNDVDDDDCSNNCALASCGDGVKQISEDCDDQNVDNTDACLDTCLAASCGDGFLQAGVEDCDDGNLENADACLDTCAPASCGDGFLQAGVEDCDDGNADDSDSCVAGCKPAICGDGLVYAGIEACDDGNAVDDDECANNCTVPADTTTDGTGGASAGMTEGTGGSDSDSDSNSGGASETGETPTTGGPPVTTDSTTTGDGSTGTTEVGIDDDFGCGCTARDPADNLRGGLLALLGLGFLVRARPRRRR